MRLAGWEERLAAVIAQASAEPFTYGIFDCATFAADAVRALTGQDHLADLRGKYQSTRDVQRLLRKPLFTWISERIGSPTGSAAFAQRGDIVLTGDKGLAVVYASDALAPAKYGLAHIERVKWLYVWSV